uniref:ORF-C n=4 Tax=Elephant endotheliotropic herpesvirus 1A TaxID=759753 RepID=A0A866VU95_ELHV1|nr:ORF-C [Elephant endotheliotropic herpesvirus 1A]
MSDDRSSYIGVDAAREHVIQTFLTDVSLGNLTHIPVSVFDVACDVGGPNDLPAATIIFRQFNICVLRLQHCERLKTLVPVHPELEKKVEEEFRELKDEIEQQKFKGPLDLAFRNLKSHKEYKRKKHFFAPEFFQFVNAQLYNFIYHLKWQRPSNKGENEIIELNFINLPQNLLQRVGRQFDAVSNQAYDFHLIDVKDVNWENGPTVTHFNRISYYSRLYHIIVDHHEDFVSRMEDDTLGNMEVLSTVIYYLRIRQEGEFTQRYLHKNLGPKLKQHNLKDTDKLTLEFIRKTLDIFFNELPLLVNFVQQYVWLHDRENAHKLAYVNRMHTMQRDEIRDEAARHAACPRYTDMNVLNIVRDFDQGAFGGPVDDNLDIFEAEVPEAGRRAAGTAAPRDNTAVPELELMRAMHRASLNDRPPAAGSAQRGSAGSRQPRDNLTPTAADTTGGQASVDLISRPIYQTEQPRPPASNVQQQAAAAALRRQQQPPPGVRRPRSRQARQQQPQQPARPPQTTETQTSNNSNTNNTTATRQVFEQQGPSTIQGRPPTETEILNELFNCHAEIPPLEHVTGHDGYTITTPLFTSVPYQNQTRRSRPQGDNEVPPPPTEGDLRPVIPRIPYESETGTETQDDTATGGEITTLVAPSHSDRIQLQIPRSIRNLTRRRAAAAAASQTGSADTPIVTPQPEQTAVPPVLRPPVFRAPSGQSSVSQQQPIQTSNVITTDTTTGTSAPSGDNDSRRAWSPPPWVRRESSSNEPSRQSQSVIEPDEQRYANLPPPPDWLFKRHGVPPRPLRVLTSIDDMSSGCDDTMTQSGTTSSTTRQPPPPNPFAPSRRPQSSGGRCRPPQNGSQGPQHSDDDDSPYPLGSRRQPVPYGTGSVTTTQPSGQLPSDDRGRPAPERRQQPTSRQTVAQTNIIPNTSGGADDDNTPPDRSRLSTFLDEMKRTNWETVEEYLNAIEEDRQRRETEAEHTNLLLPESHTGVTPQRSNNPFMPQVDLDTIPTQDRQETQRQRPSPKPKPKSLREYRRRDPLTGMGRSYTDGSTTSDGDSSDNSWSDESRRPRRRVGSTLVRPPRSHSAEDASGAGGKIKGTARKSPHSSRAPAQQGAGTADLTELAGMASLNLKSPSPRTKLTRSSSLKSPGTTTRDTQQTSHPLTRSASLSSKSSNPFMPRPPDSGGSSDGNTGSSQTSVSTLGINAQQCKFRVPNAHKMFTMVNGKPRLPRMRSAWYSSDDGGESGLECLRTPAPTRKTGGRGGSKITVDVKKIMATAKGSQQAKKCLDKIIKHAGEAERYALQQPSPEPPAGSISARAAPPPKPRTGTRSASQDRSNTRETVPVATDLIDISSAPSSLTQQVSTSASQTTCDGIQLFSVAPPSGSTTQSVQKPSSIPLQPIVTGPSTMTSQSVTDHDGSSVTKKPVISQGTFKHTSQSQPSSEQPAPGEPQPDDQLRDFIAELEGTDVPAPPVPEQPQSTVSNTQTQDVPPSQGSSKTTQQTTPSTHKSSKTGSASTSAPKSALSKTKSSASDTASGKSSTRKGSSASSTDPATKPTRKVSINATEPKKGSKSSTKQSTKTSTQPSDKNNVLLNAKVVTIDGDRINIGDSSISVFAPTQPTTTATQPVTSESTPALPPQPSITQGQQSVTNIFAPIPPTNTLSAQATSCTQPAPPPGTTATSLASHVIPEAMDIFLTPEQRASLNQRDNPQQSRQASQAPQASHVIPEAMDIFLTPEQRASLNQRDNPQSRQAPQASHVIPEAMDIFLTPEQRASLNQRDNPPQQVSHVIPEAMDIFLTPEQRASLNQTDNPPRRRVVSSFAEQIRNLEVDELKILRQQVRERIANERQQQCSPMDVERRAALDTLEDMLVSEESAAPTPLPMDTGRFTPKSDVDMS